MRKKDCKGRGYSENSRELFHCLSHKPDIYKGIVGSNMIELENQALKTSKRPRNIIKDIVKDNNNDILAKNPSHNAMAQRIIRLRKKNQVRIKEPLGLTLHRWSKKIFLIILI